MRKLAQLDPKTRAKLGVNIATPFDNIESRNIIASSAAAATTNDFTSVSSCAAATIKSRQFKDVKSNHNNHNNTESSAAVITSTESNSNFVSIPTSTSIHNSNVNNNTSGDLASVDSTDTFMSCQTHPFLSQGDLTEAIDGAKFNLDDLNSENLYMNSMEFSGIVYKYGVNKQLDSRSVQEKIKKSASGDVGSKNLLTNSMEEYFAGSHVSLDDSPKPKHQKTRLSQQKQQQLMSNNLRGKSSFDDTKETSTKGGYDSGSSTDRSSNTIVSDEMSNTKKSRKSSILHPSKMITNATKQLINQHLFGLQSKGENL